MMCDLNGRLFNVSPMTLEEHVKRRTVRKLPTWRSAPANPPALPRDLTTPVGTPLGMRAPRPGTPHVRSDRAFSVSDYVWVSIETGRVDRLKFGSVVALPDDALLRRTRCLMSLPGGDFVAVQRISSSDLATHVDRAVDGMLSSLTDIRNTREDTFHVSRDENDDKSNLRDRLSIRPQDDEETLGNRKPPDDARTVWIEYDAHGDRHNAWRDFTREATFEVYKDWNLMIGLPWCTWSNISKNIRRWRLGPADKLATTKRDQRTWANLDWNEMSYHLSSLERNVRPTQFTLSRVHGDCCLTNCSDCRSLFCEGGKPRWVTVGHYEGRTRAMDCIDPNLRAVVAKKIREELDLDNFAINSQGWLALQSKVVRPQVPGIGSMEKEHVPPREGFAKNSGSDAMTVNHASGVWTTAGRFKYLEGGYSVFLDSIFPLPLVCELGPRPQGRMQVRAWLCDKKREEDINALISSLNWCSGLKAPVAVDSVHTSRQDLTARVGS